MIPKTPENSQAMVAYSRILLCDPFIDPQTGWRIDHMDFNVRFNRWFDHPLGNTAEPAGTEGLNELLRVAFDPSTGELSFHPDPQLDCQWSVIDYGYGTCDEGELISNGYPMDRATFERILQEHKHRFHLDRSLQSVSYLLIPAHVPEPFHSGFNFGRGSTPLDRFVGMVLSPSKGDDRYQDAQQFTHYAWQCAAEMYDNTKHQNGSLVYTGTTVIPDWLKKVTHQASNLDHKMGGPTLMTAWPSNVDWFALADEHPQDIKLSIDFEDAPTLTQIKDSVSLAQEADADYWIGVQISPAATIGEPLSVCLDQLVVSGFQRDTPIVTSIIEALGGVEPEPQLTRVKGWAWEWMSCWPSTS